MVDNYSPLEVFMQCYYKWIMQSFRSSFLKVMKGNLIGYQK